MKRLSVWVSIILVGAALLNGQSMPTIQEFGGLAAGSSPRFIAAGPDGALWFTGNTSNNIARITTSGAVTEFPLAINRHAGITTGPDGALWFTESTGAKVGRITTAGVLTEYPVLPAGSNPFGITTGPDGALWFTEGLGNNIGRITTAGVITEFPVPTGSSLPRGITAGPDGALWFTEQGPGKIGRITTAGVVTEFSVPSQSGQPSGITAGPDGALWFTEQGPGKIGRITTTGVVTEFPIPTANSIPSGITTGPDGALWFTESTSNNIGRITTAGVITEFPIPSPDSGPIGITVGPDGALWFTESNVGKVGRVLVTSLSPGTSQYIITTVAGNGSPDAPQGDNGTATAAAIVPKGVAVDSFGNLFVIDAGSASGKRPPTIRKVDTTGTITTLACDGPDGLGSPPWGPVLPAHQALCGNLAGTAVDYSGDIFVTEGGGRTVDRLASGTISILSTDVNGPQNAAVDSAGNVYVADDGNCRIVKINPSGVLSIVAGNGNCGYSGDNGPAINASLAFPNGVAVDSAGNVYIADTTNARVRKVNTSGVITTVAGNGCSSYGAGDGGPATSASLCYPSAVAVDSAGNLLIVENSAGLVRRVDTSGMIATIAGTETTTALGDGGPATGASLSFPYSVAVGPAGKLYVADSGDFRVRLLTPIPSPIISSVSPSFSATGSPASTIQVTGSGFQTGSTVEWNGSSLATTYIDASHLSAAAPSSLFASAGTASVTVSNPGGVVSNSVVFTIYQTPVISSLNPNSATAGSPAFTLTVNGAGFVAGSSVNWSSAPSNQVPLQTSYMNGNQLTAVVPANLIGSPRTAQVTVNNPEQGNASIPSNTATFTVNPVSALAIITASTLPAGVVGSPYSQALDATGGATPYQGWTVVAGSLPPGISLTSLGGFLTGLLTGVPTAAGTFSFTVQVTDRANATAAKQFSLTVSGGISISANGIVNSASNVGGAVAPGEIVAIYGSGLGPSSLATLQLDSQGYVLNSLAGTQVFFDGVAAPMIYTTASQASAVVPYEVSGSTQVQVVYQGQSSNVVTMRVAATLPGIFTADSSGSGQGSIVNSDGTVNSPGNPAPAGSVIFVYATGEGQTNPAGVDGKPGDSPAPTPVAQTGVTATIGGLNAPVLYAGGVPGLVAGVLQVNVQIPTGAPSGSSIPIQVSLGGQSSQAQVTLAIR